jgi:hypothetical protein
MYKILGGDGKEYGPVSVETLRQWITEGRANARTQVLPEGSTNWIALGQLNEFANEFGATAAPAPIPERLPNSFGASRAPAEMVSGPAVGLIVTASLGAVANVLALTVNLLGVGLGAAASHGNSREDAIASLFSGTIGVISAIFALIMAAVILMGALKMRKLESYGFSMAATIIAMVPCFSPCCLVGLPIGIWALTVLVKPEVKAAFLNKG